MPGHLLKVRVQLGVFWDGVWIFCLTGISVSSLSDGIFVLHMPSEDRKQKVQLAPSAVAYLWRPHDRYKLSSASPLGWRGAAMQLRDRGGDQTGPDGLQSQLHQRQPGQVRPHRLLLWDDGGDRVAGKHSLPAFMSRSIRFAVARGREGIIDFVRGSELKVTKGKRGHLLVVSQQMFRSRVLSQQAGRDICS